MESGGYHTCYISPKSKTLKCFGVDDNHQSSVPQQHRPLSFSLGFKHTCAIDKQYDLKCWGLNYQFQSTVPETVHMKVDTAQCSILFYKDYESQRDYIRYHMGTKQYINQQGSRCLFNRDEDVNQVKVKKRDCTKKVSGRVLNQDDKYSHDGQSDDVNLENDGDQGGCSSKSNISIDYREKLKDKINNKINRNKVSFFEIEQDISESGKPNGEQCRKHKGEIGVKNDSKFNNVDKIHKIKINKEIKGGKTQKVLNDHCCESIDDDDDMNLIKQLIDNKIKPQNAIKQLIDEKLKIIRQQIEYLKNTRKDNMEKTNDNQINIEKINPELNNSILNGSQENSQDNDEKEKDSNKIINLKMGMDTRPKRKRKVKEPDSDFEYDMDILDFSNSPKSSQKKKTKPESDMIEHMINIISNDINSDSGDIGDIESDSSKYSSDSDSKHNPSTPITLPSTSLTLPSTSISAGQFHNCAITLPYSSLVCWGSDEFSESTIPFASYNHAVTTIAAGFGHTCAAIEGTLFCWGYNNKGQTDPRGEMQAVQWVAAGVEHTCAMQVGDGMVVCWGASQFINVPQQIMYAPLMVSTKYFYACGFNHRSDLVFTDKVWNNFSNNLNKNGVKKYSKEEGKNLRQRLHCWGIKDIHREHYVNGEKVGNKAMKHSLDQRMSRMFFSDRLENTQLISVSTGYQFTCAVKSNGQFRCWGLNDKAYEDWERVQDEIIS